MVDDIDISSLAVVGAGYMGGGIAVVFALSGYDVVLADVDAVTTRRAWERLVGEVQDFEARGLLAAGAATMLERHLRCADSIEEAVSGAHYVTEAVPEHVTLKETVLERISARSLPEAIIATNTSAIAIGDLAASVRNPERFLGVHWMNPAPFIPGVEIVAGNDTGRETLDRVERLIRRVGKVPTRVADTPGFVANRLQFALYHEAVRMADEGVATPGEIDAVVRNSFGFRLALFGPFAIGDMAGLDVYESSFATLERALGDRFAVPPSLSATVSAGNLGLKSGRGVLQFDPEERDALVAYRARAYARLWALREELGDAPGL
jgi:3-hydroxybutyryl-CoA dehydrogenase